MTFYSYAREQWRDRNDDETLRKIWQQRLKEWREQDAITRIERPTRIAKARSIGYKAKPGVIVVRGRVMRGSRRRRDIKAGRRPKRAGQVKFSPKKNYRQIMEERVSQKYPNLEVLNSYPVAKDGIHKWFEHVLIDPEHPAIKNDDDYQDVAKQRGRAERGLTGAGKETRGLRNKGKGAEKARPSRRANRQREN
ncbi:MAG: 50S ribosomal protein L15e [Candidatus Nanohaloarchaea archaeon]|nr:50S ribosomal protein L15e [Candidatus Nanohaloarchaea archaeon]